MLEEKGIWVRRSRKEGPSRMFIQVFNCLDRITMWRKEQLLSAWTVISLLKIQLSGRGTFWIWNNRWWELLVMSTIRALWEDEGSRGDTREGQPYPCQSLRAAKKVCQSLGYKTASMELALHFSKLGSVSSTSSGPRCTTGMFPV